MRVSWVSVSDQLGGSEVALLAMLQGLREIRPGWSFQVVLPGRGPLLARVEQAGAAVAVVPMPRPLARVGESFAVRNEWNALATVGLGARLAAAAVVLPRYQRHLGRALAAFAPDVVHTNGLKAHLVGARLARPGRSLVWHLHEYVSPRRLSRRLLRGYVQRCDAIIANSRSVADDAASVFASPPPLHVLHNAVDLDVFAPAGPTLDLDRLAELPSTAAVRVGLLAAFGRWKGHEVFVRAMREVFGRTSRAVRGYIVGGPLYDTSGSQYTTAEIERLIAANGVTGQVGLTGFVDAASAIRSLDIVVHASTEAEPFGLVVAEAMSCGRAVVTTGRGGTAEFVEDGRTALLAAPGDAPALAAAVLQLVENQSLRVALGAHARQAALERFAPSRMAAGLAAIYEGLARADVA